MVSLHPMYTASGGPWKAEIAENGAPTIFLRRLGRDQDVSRRLGPPSITKPLIGTYRSTSSDWMRSDGDMVRPDALAVLSVSMDSSETETHAEQF